MLGGYSALTVLVKAASVDAVVISARHVAPERLNNLRDRSAAERSVELSRLRVGARGIVEGDTEAATPRSPARRATIRQIKS